MNVLVQTQSLENYGVESETQWWKFKGGSTVLICGADKEANAVALVALACQRSPAWMEIPAKWEVVSDDFEPSRDWDSPNFVDEVWDATGRRLEAPARGTALKQPQKSEPRKC